MEVYSGLDLSTKRIPQKGDTLYVSSYCHDGRPITESWKYKRAIQLGIPIVFKDKVKEKEKEKIKKESFAEKYRPQRLEDLIGHNDAIRALAQWFTSLNQKDKKNGLLLIGPTGIGKSTLVNLVSVRLEYHIIYATIKPLFLDCKRLRKEVIVVEIGELSGNQIREWCSVIKNKNNVTPIIFISDEKCSTLSSVCDEIILTRPMKSTIARKIRPMLQNENINLSISDLESICEAQGNDIRSIWNQLEFYSNRGATKDAILRLDLFSATNQLFRSKWEDKERIVEVDDLIPLMIHESYPRNDLIESDLESITDRFSFGDLLESKAIDTQDSTLFSAFHVNTCAISSMIKSNSFGISFPSYLGHQSKCSRAIKEQTQFHREYRVMDHIEKELLQSIFITLFKEGQIQKIMDYIKYTGISKESLMGLLSINGKDKLIPTKHKSAFTRTYHKVYGKEEKEEKEEKE